MNNDKTNFRLKRDQVGVWGAIAEEISAMAPACDTVAFMTSAATFAFFLTPLAFLIATVTMFLEVNTLYHLSKRHASAGGYYGYIGTAFGPTPVYIVATIIPGIFACAKPLISETPHSQQIPYSTVWEGH